MSQTAIILLLLSVLTGAWLLTKWVRSYALRAGMLDVPNERSSHQRVTPRGGGVSIVLVFLVSSLVLSWTGVLDWSVSWSVIMGTGLVAAVGFWDDHGHVSAKQRLLVHFLAALLVVLAAIFSLGGLPEGILLLGYLLFPVLIVWMLNLYNFMDGIDGIAVVEGVTVALSAALLLSLQGHEGFAIWSLVLAVAIVGFGYWNWPPAKIFMGDAASGSIGYIFGAWAFITFAYSLLPIWTWLILLGVFIIDSSITLVTRILTGQRWHEAHCSHAYQNLSRKWGSHLRVTVTVLTINVLWLLPMAYLSVRWGEFSSLVCLVALLPLVLISFYSGSGRTRDKKKLLAENGSWPEI